MPRMSSIRPASPHGSTEQRDREGITLPTVPGRAIYPMSGRRLARGSRSRCDVPGHGRFDGPPISGVRGHVMLRVVPARAR
jgi:hypothetical protein